MGAAQAEHEGPVTAVGASPEGLRLCSGTEGGTVGVLDISTHQYTTLLRSHTGRVHALAADPNRWATLAGATTDLPAAQP